jgi:hypothetical protein
VLNQTRRLRLAHRRRELAFLVEGQKQERFNQGLGQALRFAVDVRFAGAFIGLVAPNSRL